MDHDITQKKIDNLKESLTQLSTQLQASSEEKIALETQLSDERSRHAQELALVREEKAKYESLSKLLESRFNEERRVREELATLVQGLLPGEVLNAAHRREAATIVLEDTASIASSSSASDATSHSTIIDYKTTPQRTQAHHLAHLDPQDIVTDLSEVIGRLRQEHAQALSEREAEIARLSKEQDARKSEMSRVFTSLGQLLGAGAGGGVTKTEKITKSEGATVPPPSSVLSPRNMKLQEEIRELERRLYSTQNNDQHSVLGGMGARSEHSVAGDVRGDTQSVFSVTETTTSFVSDSQLISEELDILKIAHRKLQNEKRNIEDLYARERSGTESQLGALEAECTRLREKVALLEKQKEEFEREYENLADAFGQLTRDYESCEDELAKLRFVNRETKRALSRSSTVSR